MALTRWEPLPVNRPFNSLFDSATVPTVAATRRFAPATDLIESDSHYIVRADLPGVSLDDVSIELSGDVLTIAGERSSRQVTRQGGYYRLERSSGSFRRSIRVPRGVDPEAIEATFDNGVLEVSVPKPVAATTHRVQITPVTTAGPALESQTVETAAETAETADTAAAPAATSQTGAPAETAGSPVA